MYNEHWTDVMYDNPQIVQEGLALTYKKLADEVVRHRKQMRKLTSRMRIIKSIIKDGE